MSRHAKKCALALFLLVNLLSGAYAAQLGQGIGWTDFLWTSSGSIVAGRGERVSAYAYDLKTGSNNGLPVTFITITPTVCSVADSGGGAATVTGLNVGTCAIVASQGGDANYLPVQLSRTIQIVQLSQVISWTDFLWTASNSIVAGRSENVSAYAIDARTGNNNGLTVTFFTSTPDVCSVVDSGGGAATVTGLRVGACVIVASQAGDVSYLPAQLNRTIQIVRLTQNIAMVNPPVNLAIGGVATVYAWAADAATGSNNGLPVTFGTTTPLVCSVVNDSVGAASMTGLKAGICKLVASQAGDISYLPSQLTLDVYIGRTQSIGIIEVSSVNVSVGRAVTVIANATSGLTVSISSLTPRVCTVVGNVVRGVATGVCTLAADQAGDAIYSPAPQVSRSVFVGKQLSDFNLDGKSDLLWRNPGTGSNAIWLSGNLATSQAVNGAVAALSAAGVGDFNGDGRSDILWRNSVSGANAVWLSGNSATPRAISGLAVSFTVAGVGDFNGDGKGDLLWRNASTGANAIWLSGNSATPQAINAAVAAWTMAGVGDFNGDGKSDILWRNPVSGANVIWLSGNSTTRQAIAGAVMAFTVAGVGDFNGDGKSDILWRNAATGGNRIWLSGNSLTQQAVGARPAPWFVAKVGDFDGDGWDDIVWRNATTGANVLWPAANSVGARGLGGRGAPWVIVK